MDPKKWVASSAIATAVAAGTLYFSKEENREKTMLNWNRLRAKWLNLRKEDMETQYKKKLGHSDPYDIEDNTMVDEGAQYSVSYYNKKQQ
ncbi:hypothetical protein [Evansella tamaricis]|uniref:Uncharacterized protein n=1 Tax=Evansella tamaricis TaxID=2069301 RepID=A0ABS6JCS7_9BACI|nr:hypothetical protein [Evansella tamaricis]MBU9711467.1 hypothetical protein [Evansella tamaricis]